MLGWMVDRGLNWLGGSAVLVVCCVRGGAGGASGAGVRSAWGGFGELAPVLAGGGVSLGLGGRVCDACVRGVLVYGGGAWAVGAEGLAGLGGAGGMVVGGMCGVSLGDGGRGGGLLGRLGVGCVGGRMRRGGLGWFGRVGRGEGSGWVGGCTGVGVVGVVDGGAPGGAWRGCVGGDMGAVGVGGEVARGRCAWRNITGGPTRASADA